MLIYVALALVMIALSDSGALDLLSTANNPPSPSHALPDPYITCPRT